MIYLFNDGMIFQLYIYIYLNVLHFPMLNINSMLQIVCFESDN